MTPHQLANFFLMPPPPLGAVFFSDCPPSKIIVINNNKITLSQDFTFSDILCYCLLYVIVLAMRTIFTISNTTDSRLSESPSQKKEKSISDLLVIAPRACGIWHLLHLNRRLMQE